jgi:hypothetical protein
VVLSLLATLATRHGSLVVAAVPVVGCVLAVTLFVVARRALRRASALIDRILREELDAAPVESRSSKDVTPAPRPRSRLPDSS